MAQTKKKRSRKHRGSPAGTVNRPASGSTKPRGKQDPKQAARERRAERLSREPSWRGSVSRAAIAAAVFGLFAALVLHYGPSRLVPLVLLMFLLYIPLGYLTDRAVYNFRQRKQR